MNSLTACRRCSSKLAWRNVHGRKFVRCAPLRFQQAEKEPFSFIVDYPLRCFATTDQRQQRVGSQRNDEGKSQPAENAVAETPSGIDSGEDEKAASPLISARPSSPAMITPPPASLINNGTSGILPTSPILRTDLGSHVEWIETQNPTFDRTKPPQFDADESGVVKRDLTESMIDLKDLYNPSMHSYGTSHEDWKGYERPTRLTEELIAYISVRGAPITVAEYMRQALTHPQYGYYTNPVKREQEDEDLFDEDEAKIDLDSVDNDWDRENDSTATASAKKGGDVATVADSIIGRRGDFVTAPEVSQVFGECLCVWFITQYETLGQPSRFQFIEVGPGKGTLLVDILRTSLQHPTFGAACRRIHLVERSPAMRAEQERQLSNLASDNDKVRFVFDTAPESLFLKGKETTAEVAATSPSEEPASDDGKPVIQVTWHESFASVVRSTTAEESSKMPSFLICQELIDALPVHQFEKTKDGWRERLVDVAVRKDDKGSEETEEVGKDTTSDNLKPRLTYVLSPNTTPALQTLLKVDESGNMQHDDKAQVGDVCEVCPEGILLVKDIAHLIEKTTGAALIVDYGQEGSTDSIRAFSRHDQVHVLSRSGEVDVTADVDFEALRHAVNAKLDRDSSAMNLPHAFGPVTQGKFLASMGAMERVIQLIEDDNTSDEQAADLFYALERLVQPEQMGERYKVLAIARKKEGVFAPPGF